MIVHRDQHSLFSPSFHRIGDLELTSFNLCVCTTVQKLAPYSQCSVRVWVQRFAAWLKLVRLVYHTLLTLNTLSNGSVEMTVAANRLCCHPWMHAQQQYYVSCLLL